MAKIKVFETTKEISKNIKGLTGKMEEIKADMELYLRLLNEAKAKAEKEARELEERKRQEELAAEKRRKEEEARREAERLEQERLEKERQQQEQARLAAEKAAKAEQKPHHEESKQQNIHQKSQKSKGAGQPASQQEPAGKELRSQTNTGRSTGKAAQSNETRKSFADGKSERGRRKADDIVDKFLSQPPIILEKEKGDTGKGTGGRFVDLYKDKNKKSKKDFWEDTNYNILDRKVRKPKKEKSVQQTAPPPERKKAITMGDIITVKELSEKIGIQAAEIIKKLLSLGILATINQEIDYDTANLIASEFNIELERKAAKTYEEQLEEEDAADKEEDLVPRPPVVTVMGHVDHGKTSLLDAIRNSHVTDAEAGGITQHIGAYTVNINNKTITFLDTPGHEAFTSMRARGAQVTDIAILVVAADDGVMPQTVEAINHAKAANVPIIVAINKIDKPTANPDRVKQELTEYGLVVEEWGGDTIAVPVSALKKEGINELLEMILLVAEMQDLKANPNRLAKGTIIEAQLDKGRGPVATILVQNGTLKVGDSVVAGTTYGRVRAMMDDKGRRLKQAGPSMPVEVLGLNEVPDAGDIMYAVEDDKLAKQVSEERKDKAKAQQVKVTSRTSLDELFNQLKEGEVKDLNIIIKADVQGSVEAVKQALEKLSNEQVRVRSIHGGVGAITESDVMLASASNAIIIGFNVRPSSNAMDLAEREGIDIRTYRIIYNAIEDIEAAMKGMLDPEYKEVILGHAEVRMTFKVSGAGTVAGSYVTDGKITRNASVRVLRNGIVVYEGKIESLKRFKDDVREVAANYECGIGLENFNDIKEGDVLEAFTLEEIKR
ncbi:MAG TPA: translation initiation factor IF-2 [Clostridiales bacterium]|nr:translation initiation factor IF-2 [Clostridiales bacterium]